MTETTNAPFTLAQARRVFVTKASPRIILAALAAAMVARVAVGQWHWIDLVGPAALLAAQPFTEWLIHVFILHMKPRRLGRRTIDPLVARKHRAHHADPKDLDLVFVPLPALIGLIGGAALVWLLAAPVHVALSGLVATYAILLTYEWTHYLIHSTYRPRRSLYRYVWRAHRNHHFRNEHYWFGVTVHLADHVLGTFPAKTDVPLSPTARTLGVDSAA